MKIVHLSSEARPWASSGGLAEVASALSAAQQQAGDEVWLWLPAYASAKATAARRGEVLRDSGVGGEVVLPVGRWRWRALVLEPATAAGLGAAGLGAADGSGAADEETAARRVGFIDCPDLFDREGLYHGADHQGFGDNALRFAVFVRAAMAAAPALLGAPPDILHSHDWQTALAPFWLATERPTAWGACRSAFTIHNLGYPGRFPRHVADDLGLGGAHFHPDGLEFYGDLALIKAGIIWADVVTTVSPTYAREIRTPAHGEGFDGLLRHHSDKLHGILNGIDGAWRPDHDPLLPATYTADDLTGKATCRADLLAEMGLPEPVPADPATTSAGRPVLASISRFAAQKGLDLLADVAADIVAADARLIVLGSGDPALERRFRSLAARFPNHIAVRIGYDIGLSHRIEAGADAFVMPSRYEPCGLNQLYSMAYGTPPIVHRTGGLADTVAHASADALRRGTATGVVFDHPTADGLRWAVLHTIALFRERPEAWRTMQLAGMARDASWLAAAQQMRALYDAVRARPRDTACLHT